MEWKVALCWSLCATIILVSQAGSHAVEPPTKDKACDKTVADIVFLVDESGRLGNKNFLKVKQFVIDVVGSLKIGENNIRVGVITFSTRSFIQFHLNRYFDKRRIINAIKNIRYFGGNSNTAKALRNIRYNAFAKRNGKRIGVSNIAIIVTDGKSSYPKETRKQAAGLRDSGVIVFSIGIGKYLRQKELAALASRPTSEYRLTVESFDAVQHIVKNITRKTCEDSCISKVCQHGGTCMPVAQRLRCICKPQYYGEYCQHKKVCDCNGYGKHHYKTFDGQRIYFPGICKYTMAASTKRAPNYFAVEVKNEIQGNNRVSYTRYVDIKLKRVTIRLISGNRMLVNGENRTLPIRDVWGFSARYACGWITVTTSWGLKVQFDGRHRVKVKLAGRFFNKLTGICGNCNGKKDDFRTKQGKDVSRHRNKYFLIGNSYKVTDNSNKPTTKCNVPNLMRDCKARETIWCNSIKHEIFRKCIGKLGQKKAEEYLKSCRIDSCAYRRNTKHLRTIVCNSIESFAEECAKSGVNVDWRRFINCPMTCPPRQVYKFATSTCQPSCGNPNPKCSGLIEGCVCKKGFVLSGNKCVTKSECGCFYKGLYIEANENFMDSKCKRKTICKAGGKLVTENLSSCQLNGICTLQNYKRVCVCKKGFYLHNGKCFAQACNDTVADIVFLLDESGSLGYKNFLKVKQFVIDIVGGLKIGKDDFRVGVVTFSTYTFMQFHLNKYFDKPRVIKAIKNIRYFGGYTNTDKALRSLRDTEFTKKNGDRIGVPDIVIAITDGKSSNPTATRKQAEALKDVGVVIYTIGVGRYLRHSELVAISSKPTSEHKLTVDTFAELQSLRNKITTEICKEKVYYCNENGKHHYKTFDGQMIYFPGICKYTLAASTKRAPNYFAVEVKNEHHKNNSVLYTRMVDIKLKGVTIRLMPGNKMLVNGEKQSLPIRDVWGFSARYACGWITVTTSWGLNVQFDGRHRIMVKVNGNFFNKLTGICGNCNGRKDDLRTKEGRNVFWYRNKYFLIGNSYRVKDENNKTTTKCDLLNRKIGCNPPKNSWCNLIKHMIFRECVGKLGKRKAKEYFKSCQTDNCIYRNNRINSKTIVCSAIESFAGECAKVGVNVDWRRIANCPKTCPPRHLYKVATPICQPSCSNPTPKCTGLIEGCVCRRGFILSGKKCVPKSECGCFYKGLYMEANEDIIDPKCERKTICKAGGKLVTEKLSPCQPNGKCILQNYKRVCVCKYGFYMRNGKCIPKAKECPPRQIYKFFTPICQPSCANPNPKCTGWIQGCVCKKGFLLSGNKCVTKSECGCIYKGSYMEANETTIDSKCERKITCKAGGELVTEDLLPCQPNGICTLRNNKHVCVCKRGFYIHNGKCSSKACDKTVADIVFLVDESGSLGYKNFLKVKQFVIDIVGGLKIGKDDFRVGVVTFSTYTFMQFHLNKYFDKPRVINAIKNIRYFGGYTNTDKALRSLRDTEFTKKNGDRIGVPNIVIAITDGKSSNPTATRKQAEALKDLGVVIYTIGVGRYLRHSELVAISSKPTSEHKLTVDTFADLQSLRNKITTEICKEKVYYCNENGKHHYKTFDGQMIYFPGICKYTLAASTKRAPNYFAVEVKNEHHKNNSVLYTRMVDIKLKGVTIRLMPGNKMLVNGEKQTLPIRDVWGFSARYACGWITVTTSWGLNVQFDGRHRIMVKVNGNFFNKLTGICGNCNGRKDDLRTKEGRNVFWYRNKYFLIGNSYRVKDESNKTTTKCDLLNRKIGCNPPKKSWCNLMKHMIFRECVGKLGKRKAKEYFKSCQTDNCIYRNNKRKSKTIVCSAIESFAGECAKVGVNVDWRRIANCTKTCPPRHLYKVATPICQPSCSNPEPKCTGLIEGCVCRRGFILSGKKCVPKSECGCFYKGLYMEANEDIIDPKCERKTICKAGGKLVTEKLSPCQPNGKCILQNYKRVCVCKDGFYMRNGKCIPKVKECPPRQIYKFFTPFCQPSCANPNPKCTGWIQGCVCKKGFLLSGNKCVTKSECGCIYKGSYMEANKTTIDSKCERKITCKAGGELVTEDLLPCQPNGICTLRNNKHVCVCKRGFYIHNGKCSSKACDKTVADIVFLVDESGRVRYKNFLKVKQFVIDIVGGLKIGKDNFRVGVVTFSTYTFMQFHLNKYFDKPRVINAIKNIRYFGGYTNTDKALRSLRDTEFTKKNGDRIGVPNIVIAITDGKSSNPTATRKQAEALKDLGVVIYTIGVGRYLRHSELVAISSKPTSEHKLTVDTFAELQSLRNKITTEICKEKVYECNGFGNFHYKTFDGRMLHSQRFFRHTLVASTKKAPYFFIVQIRSGYRGKARMVCIKLKRDTIRLLPGNKMLVNREQRSFPFTNVWGLSASYSTGWVTVSTSWGLTVEFDGIHRVKVKVDSKLFEKLTGVCFDGVRKKNTFSYKRKVVLQRKPKMKYQRKFLVNVNKGTRRFGLRKNKKKVSNKNTVCKPEETRRCNIIKHQIFRKCIEKVGMKTVEEYWKACKFETCRHRRNRKLFQTNLCFAIEGFAEECLKADVNVNWRRVAKCPMKCSPSQEYKLAAPICQPSCTNRNPNCTGFIEGCVCRKGFILSGTKCVPKSKCGCFYNGLYMEANEDILDSKCERKITCKAGGKLIRETLVYCQPNGKCRIRNNKRTCVCKRGFNFQQGKCIPKVHPCHSRPCKNGGTCKRNGKSHTCVCKMPFYGKDCSEIHSCHSRPCKNGGTCKRNGKTHTCVCKMPFYGIDCSEINPCHSRPCKNGGTCKRNGKTHTCVCKMPFYGIDCSEIHPCHSRPCKNGGTCKRNGKTHTCVCKMPFYGKDCSEIHSCHSRPCKNGGTCKRNGKTHTCVCKMPFYGIDCSEINPCHSRPCENGGTCKLNGKAHTCVCKMPFYGKDCSEIHPCHSRPCKNGGTCKRNGKTHTCVCKMPFYGIDCSEIHSCHSRPCKNGGTCKRNGKTHTCVCKMPFYGIDCSEINPCHSRPCKNGGTCKLNGKAHTCVCKMPFYGKDCSEIHPCHSRPCKNGGTCKRNGKTHTCVCKMPFYGKDCSEINPCHSRPCKNGGTCKRNGKTHTCVCKMPFYGKDCSEIHSCHSRPCKNGGTCKLNGKVHTCVCKMPFYGKDCSEINPCHSRPCKNGGTCKRNGKTHTCVCKMPFYGIDCSEINPCHSRPCKNGGTCKRNGKTHTCVCKMPFYGKDCSEIHPCHSRPCKNGGTCKRNGKTHTCVCKMPFYGKDCSEINPCHSRPCKNGGTCKRNGKTHTCVCKMPFYGIDCSGIHPCHDQPCKNGGTCERKGNTYMCICKIPFYGKNCSEIASDCKCSAWGDPHYETFDGQMITFMGISKYTLTTSNATCKLPYFAVEVKNEHRGNTHVSYTRFIDLKIKGVTVRLWSDNKLSVNGEMMTLPLTDYMGFTATYSGGWITANTNFGVQVVFDGRHRIYVKVPGSYREQLIGLCGNCNGLKDDLKTKDGVDVSKKLNAFSLIGQSYEVFDDTSKSQECHKVVDFISNCSSEETKVCNRLKNPSGPFSKCSRRLGSSSKHYYQSCIIDVCANKNLPKIQHSVMCQSYEALATKCEELGIIVKWRSVMNCPMKCPKDKLYAERTSRCQPTCLDPTPMCPLGPTEGCICKPDTILSGTTCVLMNSCGCTYKGMYRMAGTDLLLNSCSQTITCTAINTIEKKPGCSENFICPIIGGERQCVCKKGYKISNGKCKPSWENLNLTIPDPKVLKKFARVFVAFLRETAFQKIHAKFPEICAQSCLNDKRCKSFNFNKLMESCELLSVNAEYRTLEASDYRYDEYYQLIGFKGISIGGAEIFSCENLLSYKGVKTLADCKNKCRQQGCKAMEYSPKQARCSITKSTRDSFELMANVQLKYYANL